MSKIIRVFLASTSGLDDERDAVRNAVQRINSTLGIKFDVQLSVLSYNSTVHPGVGADAQDVINQQIGGNYDTFVGILWERVGTQTKREVSGTIEEYKRAQRKRRVDGNVDVMMYFKSDAVNIDDVDAGQLRLLHEFKKKVSDDGALYSSFGSTREFADKIREDLESVVLERLLPTPRTAFVKDYLIQDASSTRLEGEKQNASLAIVVDGCVLIARRAGTLKIGPGLWQLPGGKVEDGEAPLDAALREMREELGLEFESSSIKKIGAMNSEALGVGKCPIIKMSLYYRESSERPKLRLESSISEVHWLPLSEASSCGFDFLGDNLRMLRLVRRYHFAYRPLKAVFEVLSNSVSPRFPRALPGFSADQTQTLLATLDVLGFLGEDDLSLSRRPESIALFGILLEWCKTTRSIFEARGSSDWQTSMLLLNSGERLARFQKTLFESHESLSALMSYKLAKVLSQREVCDVLIFAMIRGEVCILLRRDIQDKREEKYQILSKGLEGMECPHDMKDDSRARHVVQARLSESLASAFSYEWLDHFQTFHVGAGSMENVNLTRQYDVSVFLATIPDDYVVELLETVAARNRQAALVSEREGVSRETRGEAVSLRWVPLEALLVNKLHYDGRRVRGFSELFDRLGERGLRMAAEKGAADLAGYEALIEGMC